MAAVRSVGKFSRLSSFIEIAALAAFLSFPAGSAATGATLPEINPANPATARIMDDYPPAALAAGVGGAALLQCHETKHARLVDCILFGESPVGYNFGEAAINIAKLSKDNPDVTKTPQPGGLVQFTFRLNPPSIEPNTLLPLTNPLSATAPHYRERPDFALLRYPDGAAGGRIKGRVVLDCVLTADGPVKSCVAAEETPKGLGFGQAAIDFAATFRMQPPTVNGQPRIDAHVLIPISFLPRG